ncbi:MAG: HisA/HisF-related TIM barrel protein [Promethearchaeota archaeon]
MQLIPVMDIKGGIVVHGKGGSRDRYPPVPRSFCSDPRPLTVARTYRERFGFTRLYVADLDAIETGVRSFDYLEPIKRELGMEIFIDAGVNNEEDARFYIDKGVEKLIIGTETLESLDQLRELVGVIPIQKLLVSVDFKDGAPLTKCPDLKGKPVEIVFRSLRELGVRQFLYLDLSAVGTERGTSNPVDLLEASGFVLADVQIYLGGGLSEPSELEFIARSGVAGIMAATIFYRGAINASQVQPYL